jgi:hypothetical protein
MRRALGFMVAGPVARSALSAPFRQMTATRSSGAVLVASHPFFSLHEHNLYPSLPLAPGGQDVGNQWQPMRCS